MALRRLQAPEAYGPDPVRACFWNETTAPQTFSPISGDQHAEVAIVGGGYTGLSTAYHLAKAGVDVVLLDGQQPGWGASGRNGGFCCLGGAKADHAAIAARYGHDEARGWAHAERAAVELVAELLETHAINADTHSQGETLLAHSAHAFKGLEQERDRIRAVYGLEAELISGAEALVENGLAVDLSLRRRTGGRRTGGGHGALTTPIGFALNPLKYAQGLVSAATNAGARLFGTSLVTAHRRENAQHVLTTAHGQLRAKTVVFATNGYSADNLPWAFANRYLPVQSNILVSRVLRDDELKAQGWTSRQMCYDSRHLLHYFRLLPDNRMLMGMRGATFATPAAFARARGRARRDFEAMFPAWRDVETPWFWSGMLAGARRMVPFCGALGGMESAFAALCYHGNGVAMATWAGRNLAARITGKPHQAPGFLARPLAPFPLGRYRRFVLPLAYKWYRFQDLR